MLKDHGHDLFNNGDGGEAWRDEISMVVAIGTMSVFAMIHLITLPVEWNASFRRALPILEEGE